MRERSYSRSCVRNACLQFRRSVVLLLVVLSRGTKYKEQLAGTYILNCKDLDEAIELAAMIPDAQHGSIEIRPIMEL
jgi:YCII-related domain